MQLVGINQIVDLIIFENKFDVLKYTNYKINIENNTNDIIHFHIKEDQQFGKYTIANGIHNIIYFNGSSTNITILVEANNNNYILKLIPLNMEIKQIYVAEHLRPGFGENIKNSFPFLKNYSSDSEPTFFYGLWSDDDLDIFKKNKSLKVIIWSGGDINTDEKNRGEIENHRVMTNINQIKNIDKVYHISKSSFIDASLRRFNIEFKHIPFMAVDFNLYKPSIKGNSIYIYTAPLLNYYGCDFYEKIVDKYKDINFIFACCQQSYNFFVDTENIRYLKQYKIRYYDKSTLINKIYTKCFLALRLTIHDGIANSVQELGLMGIKSVHNGCGPSCLNYSTLEDICQHIENERKSIGTCDHELIFDMKKYLTLPENMFTTNFYQQ